MSLNFITVHMHPYYTNLYFDDKHDEFAGNIVREKFTYKPHDFFFNLDLEI